MSTQKLLIIGQGDTGLPVTNKLAQNGLDVTGWHVVSAMIMLWMIKQYLCKPMR